MPGLQRDFTTIISYGIVHYLRILHLSVISINANGLSVVRWRSFHSGESDGSHLTSTVGLCEVAVVLGHGVMRFARSVSGTAIAQWPVRLPTGLAVVC